MSKIKQLSVKHQGSLATATIFRKENGDCIKVKVFFGTECTVSNQLTFYKYEVYSKGFKCRNWDYLFTNSSIDLLCREDIGLTKVEVYKAFHNHWNKLNPFRLFRTGSIDGLMKFPEDFEEIAASSLKNGGHKAY